MGDRRCVAVQDQGQRVYLYTHWSGSELPQILKAALARGRSRWTDPSYLARIIFCQMVSGEEGGETGFGISTQEPGDVQGPTLVVNCDNQTVDVGGKSTPFAIYAGVT